MNSYEKRVRMELLAWEHELLQPPGMLQRASKRVQGKIHEKIPEKVQGAITAAVKGMVQTCLYGLDYVPKKGPTRGWSLEACDRRAHEVIKRYRTVAAAEGAGAGLGGFVLGLVDFGALIAIKMSLLFELAHVYGYDTRQDMALRGYLLHIFQVAFSGADVRGKVYRQLKREAKGEGNLGTVDWEQFQREYRDAIDLRKMLQLVPGIGSIVGAWANYGFLDELGAAGMNGLRMKRLAEMAKEPPRLRQGGGGSVHTDGD